MTAGARSQAFPLVTTAFERTVSSSGVANLDPSHPEAVRRRWVAVREDVAAWAEDHMRLSEEVAPAARRAARQLRESRSSQGGSK